MVRGSMPACRRVLTVLSVLTVPIATHACVDLLAERCGETKRCETVEELTSIEGCCVCNRLREDGAVAVVRGGEGAVQGVGGPYGRDP